MKQQIHLHKTFEVEELGTLNVTYTYDEETDTYKPLGEDGTEVTDCTVSNFYIESMELEIMGVGFILKGPFKEVLGKIKYDKLFDALQNAS